MCGGGGLRGGRRAARSREARGVAGAGTCVRMSEGRTNSANGGTAVPTAAPGCAQAAACASPFRAPPAARPPRPRQLPRPPPPPRAAGPPGAAAPPAPCAPLWSPPQPSAAAGWPPAPPAPACRVQARRRGGDVRTPAGGLEMIEKIRRCDPDGRRPGLLGVAEGWGQRWEPPLEGTPSASRVRGWRDQQSRDPLVPSVDPKPGGLVWWLLLGVRRHLWGEAPGSLLTTSVRLACAGGSSAGCPWT